MHFSGNKNKLDKTNENNDRLWKTRTISDKLNDAYAKYYRPTKHSAGDGVTVLFKERVVFKQYIPKKHKCFGIKIYKICNSKTYTYNLSVYLERNKKCTTAT
jgi:hypothetical protein